MPPVKRDYRSQYRRGQAKLLAEGTRRVIVNSARKLFANRGYGATTIEAIAREGGIAVQTVYANFGTKRAILLELLQMAQAQGELLTIIGQFAAEKDPARMVRLGAAFNRRFYEQAGDVIRIMVGAAASDPVIAKLEHLAEEDVRGRCARVVRAWARSGALRKGMSQKEATDLLVAFTSPEIFRLLVTSSGWSPDEYEAWFVVTLESLILGTPYRPVLAASRSRPARS
jgi:AcrR family transcriptional regulator